MDSETLVLLGGVHRLGFAIFHMAFWRLFHWPRALASTNVATRAVVQILNLRLIYVLPGAAALGLFLPDGLLGTRLGHTLPAGMSLPWVGRTIEQFVFLRYNTWPDHALTVLLVAGALLFALPLLRT